MGLRAENISKRYFRKTGSANYFYAVNSLNMEIRNGEVAVLMGRSGSGKTTLLSMLSGLLAPTEGKVWIDNIDLYSLKDKALSCLRNEKIGVVPQGHSAIETLTVLENILLPEKLYGKKLPVEKALYWMEKLGISNLREARPAELSGGELRRMSVIRALAQNPEVLFADEPTGDLDDENTNQVLCAFRDYAHEEKKTVLLVTHENDAMHYADQIYHMENGNLSTTV